MRHHKVNIVSLAELPVGDRAVHMPEGTQGYIEVIPPVTVDAHFQDAVLGQNADPGVQVDELVTFPNLSTVIVASSFAEESTFRNRYDAIQKLGERIRQIANHPETGEAMKSQSPFAGY